MDFKVHYSKDSIMVLYVHIDLKIANTFFSSNDNHFNMYWYVLVCHLVP